MTKSIGTKMNELDLCLELVPRSLSIIASHSPLNISETVRYNYRLGSKGEAIGNGLWGIEWSRDR